MDELLKQLGLAPGEAAVYQALLEQESGSPAELATATKLKRPDTYNKLSSLVQKKLVEEFTARNGRKRYRLEHPQKLQDYLNQREQQLHTVERQLDSALPDLVSRYQLAAHKPGVSYFEGRTAFERILADSLTAEGTIDSFLDPQALNQYEKENKAYKAQRFARNIRKRILVTDSPENRARYEERSNEWTIARLLEGFDQTFHTDMQIYNDKVSYLTLKRGSLIGMIIQDPFIAHLQRSVFQQLWQQAEPVGYQLPEL